MDIDIIEKLEDFGLLVIPEAIDEIKQLRHFAKRLALALADEVAFFGGEHVAEASLDVLSEARTLLELEEGCEGE